MRRPNKLYETPPKWGAETFWLSRHEAEAAVRELRRMGWCATLDECRVWYRQEGDRYEEPRSGEVMRFRYESATKSWVPLGTAGGKHV